METIFCIIISPVITLIRSYIKYGFILIGFGLSAQCSVDVVIEIGQSNAVSPFGVDRGKSFGNNLIWNTNYDAGTNTGLVRMLFNENSGGIGGIGNNQYFKHSIGSYIADTLAQTTGKQTVLFKIARGNSSLCDRVDLVDWSQTSGELFLFFTNQWDLFVAELASRGWSANVVKVIWTQGESDAIGTCIDEYVSNFFELKSRVNANIGQSPQWIVTTIGTCQTTNANYQLIRAEQLAFPITLASVYDVDPCTTGDGTHFNQETLHQKAIQIFEMYF